MGIPREEKDCEGVVKTFNFLLFSGYVGSGGGQDAVEMGREIPRWESRRPIETGLSG
jgi:hypothetical protein